MNRLYGSIHPITCTLSLSPVPSPSILQTNRMAQALRVRIFFITTVIAATHNTQPSLDLGDASHVGFSRSTDLYKVKGYSLFGSFSDTVRRVSLIRSSSLIIFSRSPSWCPVLCEIMLLSGLCKTRYVEHKLL